MVDYLLEFNYCSSSNERERRTKSERRDEVVKSGKYMQGAEAKLDRRCRCSSHDLTLLGLDLGPGNLEL